MLYDDDDDDDEYRRLMLPEHATTDYWRWREWGENHGPDIYILVSVRTAFNCHLPRCVQTLERQEHRQDAPDRMQHLCTVEGRREGIADARRYKWLVFACSGSVNLYFISTYFKRLVLDEDICCQNTSNLKRISELCAISAFQQPLSLLIMSMKPRTGSHTAITYGCDS
jgi:hypothetical protein